MVRTWFGDDSLYWLYQQPCSQSERLCSSDCLFNLLLFFFLSCYDIQLEGFGILAQPPSESKRYGEASHSRSSTEGRSASAYCASSVFALQMWWRHTTIPGDSCPCHWVAAGPCSRSCCSRCSRSLCCPLTSTCSWSPGCCATGSCVQRTTVPRRLRPAQPSWSPAGRYCRPTERWRATAAARKLFHSRSFCTVRGLSVLRGGMAKRRRPAGVQRWPPFQSGSPQSPNSWTMCSKRTSAARITQTTGLKSVCTAGAERRIMGAHTHQMFRPRARVRAGLAGPSCLEPPILPAGWRRSVRVTLQHKAGGRNQQAVAEFTWTQVT